MPSTICHWPELPGLPVPGRPVLVRVQAGTGRAAARAELRTVLRQILAHWSGLDPDRVPLSETPRGPVLESLLQGVSLDTSFSYAEGEAWIALLRGSQIGLDVMDLAAVPQWEDLARIYLSPADQAFLQRSNQPRRDFALAWTQLEARCKCVKSGLTEWSEASAVAASRCSVESSVFEERLMVTLATVR